MKAWRMARGGHCFWQHSLPGRRVCNIRRSMGSIVCWTYDSNSTNLSHSFCNRKLGIGWNSRCRHIALIYAVSFLHSFLALMAFQMAKAKTKKIKWMLECSWRRGMSTSKIFLWKPFEHMLNVRSTMTHNSNECSIFVDIKLFWTLSSCTTFSNWNRIPVIFATMSGHVRCLLHNYGKNTECRAVPSSLRQIYARIPNWVPPRSVSNRRRRRSDFITVDVDGFYSIILEVISHSHTNLSNSFVPIDLVLRMEWEMKRFAFLFCCIVDIYFVFFYILQTFCFLSTFY